MPINPTKSLKNSLLSFVRYFYDESLQYIDNLIEQWIKSFVQFVIWIFINGLAFYLALCGLVFVFPKISSYIFIGTAYWQIFVVIMFLGIILYFIKTQYKFFRGGYK